MDKFQRKLRTLIVAGSAVGFLGGWGLLAHAGKPVANASASVDDQTQVSAAPLAPIKLPPLDFNQIESGGGSSNLQPLQPLQVAPAAPNTFARPRLRTRTS